MDGIIVTAAVVLAVIAIIEITTLFFRLPKGNRSPLYVAVVPVFSEDKGFPQRLERLALKSGGRCNLIIVDYSADETQKELCRQFIKENPDAVFIYHGQLEKLLSEMFAIQREI